MNVGVMTDIARATYDFKFLHPKKYFIFKKLKRRIYSDFSAITDILPFDVLTSIFHCNLSPGDNSNTFAISLGTIALREFDLLFAKLIFDWYLNIIITLHLCFYSNKFVSYVINIYPFKLLYSCNLNYYLIAIFIYEYNNNNY